MVAALYNKAFPTTPFLCDVATSRDDEGRATLKKSLKIVLKIIPTVLALRQLGLEPNDKQIVVKYRINRESIFGPNYYSFEMLWQLRS